MKTTPYPELRLRAVIDDSFKTGGPVRYDAIAWYYKGEGTYNSNNATVECGYTLSLEAAEDMVASMQRQIDRYKENSIEPI